ncbi:uncharacterized protein LOC134222795 [Armigeres subalbatus]|uniref:uncharacterized protein LOC134222795 n=1 Tax=Armigeres subalbatus TaxID=124917 RepID=UPI002ED330EE
MDVTSVFNYRTQFDAAYFKVKDLYTEFLDANQDRVSWHSASNESPNDLRDAIRALLQSQHKLIDGQHQPQQQVAAGNQMSNHEPTVKLPQLNIPIFCGERKSWNSFKDLFISTIHNRVDLKASVKMQYLFSYLDGEAKRILKALGNEYETRDPWLIHLLLEKVDRETRTLWAQKIIDEENPLFADFIEFLQKRCDTLETCAAFSRKAGESVKNIPNIPKNIVAEKKFQAFHCNQRTVE